MPALQPLLERCMLELRLVNPGSSIMLHIFSQNSNEVILRVKLTTAWHSPRQLFRSLVMLATQLRLVLGGQADRGSTAPSPLSVVERYELHA